LNTIELRHATESDIENIMLLYKSCVKQMNEKGLFNWNENYPSYLFAKADIEKQQLYISEINGELVGCMSLLKSLSKEYIEQLQLSKSDDCITIKRLAVHPKFQNKGIANNLYQFQYKMLHKSFEFNLVRLRRKRRYSQSYTEYF